MWEFPIAPYNFPMFPWFGTFRNFPIFPTEKTQYYRSANVKYRNIRREHVANGVEDTTLGFQARNRENGVDMVQKLPKNPFFFWPTRPVRSRDHRIIPRFRPSPLCKSRRAFITSRSTANLVTRRLCSIYIPLTNKAKETALTTANIAGSQGGCMPATKRQPSPLPPQSSPLPRQVHTSRVLSCPQASQPTPLHLHWFLSLTAARAHPSYPSSPPMTSCCLDTLPPPRPPILLQTPCRRWVGGPWATINPI